MRSTKSVVSLAALGAFFGLASFPFWARGAAPQEGSVNAWIGRQHEALAILKESFSRPHPYRKTANAESKTSSLFAVEPRQDEALRSHVRHGWRGTSIRHFQAFLDLDKNEIPDGDQSDSEKMAATVLMNHFFGPLEKLGYRTRGSGFAAGSALQKTSNEWYRIKITGPFEGNDEGLGVEGAVIVSLQDGQALICGTIRARYIDE